MKKIIYGIIFLGFALQMQSQTSLKDLLQTKNWTTASSRQLSNLKIEHNKYDLILMSEEKADMVWGNVIKLDSLNNYRDFKSLRCGTPPYSIYNITGNWKVSGDKICISIKSATLDCTYEAEKCKNEELKFLKRKEERKIEYTLKAINHSLIVGIKLK